MRFKTAQTGPVARGILSLALAIAPLSASGPHAEALPELGDEATTLLSSSQERALGASLIQQARGGIPFLDDPETSDYLQSLGARLIAQAEPPAPWAFRYFIVNDPAINAFALPGGYIAVNTGLILASTTEAEFAGVIAHESAHVLQRHLPRLLVEQQRLSVASIGGYLAAILLASVSGQAATAAVVATQAATTQSGINYTRTFEEEADRIGMKLLTGSGFDPRGMPDFFERLQVASRTSETEVPEYLRTHPVTASRIADARGRAASLGARPMPEERQDFHEIRARVRALVASSPDTAVSTFREQLASGKFRSETAERYGYAIALLRAHELDEARRQAARLLKTRPGHIPFQILAAEIEHAATHTALASSMLAAAHAQQPGNTLITRAWVNVLLDSHEPARARDLIRELIRHDPSDPAPHRLLARAATELGSPLEAHEAMAEHYALSGDRRSALEQLRLALKRAGDNFYTQSRIEARILAIESEAGARPSP